MAVSGSVTIMAYDPQGVAKVCWIFLKREAGENVAFADYGARSLDVAVARARIGPTSLSGTSVALDMEMKCRTTAFRSRRL